LLSYVPDMPINEAFGVADEVLARMMKGITETISTPSLVNLDFADVRAVMREGSGKGIATIGLGESDTSNRSEEAVTHALENPLIKVDYRGATGALIHITGGPDMTLSEAIRIGEIATGYLANDANVIWGARIDEAFAGRVQVMLIITGVAFPDTMWPEDIQIPNRSRHLDGGRSEKNAVQTQETEGLVADLGIDYII